MYRLIMIIYDMYQSDQSSIYFFYSRKLTRNYGY